MRSKRRPPSWRRWLFTIRDEGAAEMEMEGDLAVEVAAEVAGAGVAVEGVAVEGGEEDVE